MNNEPSGLLVETSQSISDLLGLVLVELVASLLVEECAGCFSREGLISL